MDSRHVSSQRLASLEVLNTGLTEELWLFLQLLQRSSLWYEAGWRLANYFSDLSWLGLPLHNFFGNEFWVFGRFRGVRKFSRLSRDQKFIQRTFWVLTLSLTDLIVCLSFLRWLILSLRGWTSIQKFTLLSSGRKNGSWRLLRHHWRAKWFFSCVRLILYFILWVLKALDRLLNFLLNKLNLRKINFFIAYKSLWIYRRASAHLPLRLLVSAAGINDVLEALINLKEKLLSPWKTSFKHRFVN